MTNTQEINFIVKFDQVIVRSGEEHETYEGPYTVTPKFTSQVLSTDDKLMTDDVTVEEIKVAKVYNPQGGNTVTIG